MSPNDERHGTTRGYHAGCRDLCCRRAIARYEKEGRLARLNGGRAVPALGAQRRLQALMALGWSSNAIAVAANRRHRNHVWRVVNGQNGKPTRWLQRETDEWVRQVYTELSTTTPTGRYVARTRAHAERMGWPPPSAWLDPDDPDEQPDPGYQELRPGDELDPVVVDRILGGDWTLARSATTAERIAVVAQWPGTRNELERRTGWRAHRYIKTDEVA